MTEPAEQPPEGRSGSGGPDDPTRLRASDADRDRVAEVIREAAGEGRLDLAEVDERISGIYAARTYAELERFTEDLPATGTGRPDPAVVRPSRAAGSGAARVGGTPGPKVSIAIMSGASRRGRWVVPPKYTAVAFWGGAELDLREARFAERESTIYAFALMGGIDIVVPDDVEVIVDGVGVMGGFDDSRKDVPDLPPDPKRPVLRIKGLAFWGGVTVRYKRPKSKPKPQVDGPGSEHHELGH